MHALVEFAPNILNTSVCTNWKRLNMCTCELLSKFFLTITKRVYGHVYSAESLGGRSAGNVTTPFWLFQKHPSKLRRLCHKSMVRPFIPVPGMSETFPVPEGLIDYTPRADLVSAPILFSPFFYTRYFLFYSSSTTLITFCARNYQRPSFAEY